MPRATAATIDEVVGATASPFLQLEGETLAHSPDGILTLTRLRQPARVTWLAEGLLPEGGISNTHRVRLAAYRGGSSAAHAEALTAVLSFESVARTGGAAASHAFLDVTVGRTQTHVKLTSGGTRVVKRLVTCLASNARVAAGTIAVRHASAGPLAGYLGSVTLIRGGACANRAQRPRR
jgi:hypothetical protein